MMTETDTSYFIPEYCSDSTTEVDNSLTHISHEKSQAMHKSITFAKINIRASVSTARQVISTGEVMETKGPATW